jgi:predicted Zn-dependent protease
MLSLQVFWLRCQGRLALLLGQHEAALRALETLGALAPDDAHALASRAHIEDQRGHPERAIELQQELVVLAPGRGAHWFNLGFMLEKAGRRRSTRPRRWCGS